MTVPIDPGWLSVLPPVAAIALALIFREVVISLFAGVWLGALFIAGWDPLAATLTAVDTYVVGSLSGDPDHVAIIMFSLMLGGMVGVMSRSGGTQGIVEAMEHHATSRRRGQFYTWLAGVLVFFDDYANTLIVGNTFRPVTDRLNISREKLAYIVDSTAAPMAAIAVITTWVGFEISLIGDALGNAAANVADPAMQAELMAGAENPFNVFLHSIPFLFYPILALLFVFMTLWMRREFGPMLAAELRAATGGGLYRVDAQLAADTSGGIMEPPDGAPHRWVNAGIPVISVILVAMLGIYFTGKTGAGADAGLREIVGAADPFKSLIWASFTGSVVAMVMAVGQGILSTRDTIEAWMGGLRSMMLAMIILTLAWALGDVTEALGTGPYLSNILKDTLPMQVLPALTLVVAAAISFSTGTSWGTMAILYPVVIPLAVAMGAGVGFHAGNDYTVLLGVVSSIMAGSIFGDHCSPISDTTVMSSMASGCDHVDHVRTQLPYALLVAIVAMAVGDIPTAYGMNPFLSLAIGATILVAFLWLFGKPVQEAIAEARAEQEADPETAVESAPS